MGSLHSPAELKVTGAGVLGREGDERRKNFCSE